MSGRANTWQGFVAETAAGALEGGIVDPFGYRVRIVGRRCVERGRAGWQLTGALEIPDSLRIPLLDDQPEGPGDA